MKIAVITEKGTVAQALADALVDHGRENFPDQIIGNIGTDRVCIIWPDGHALDLASPERYRPEWGRWTEDDLPIQPPGYRFINIPKKPAFLRLAAAIFRQADLVVNACDPAREGELIFQEIVVHTRAIRPVAKIQRMWLQSTTAAGVRQAWAARDNALSTKYMDLSDAAQARREADWLWGINFTRKVTCRSRRLYPRKEASSVYHIGRVQTPLLKLIYDRGALIDAFKTREFYRLNGDFECSGGKFRAAIGAFQEMRLGNHATFFKSFVDVQNMRQQVTNNMGSPWETVDSIEAKRDQAPAPFSLVELQKAANLIKGLSLTAKQTLDIAQQLYFVEKAITYPRTNSNYFLTADRDHILRVRDDLFQKWAVPIFPRLREFDLPPAQEHWFDDEKVTDHHGIMPTGIIPRAFNDAGHLRVEYMLWQVITLRFIQAFLPPAEVLAASRILILPVPGHPELKYRAMLECAPIQEAGWMEFEDRTFNTRGMGPTLERSRKEVLFPSCDHQGAMLRHLYVQSGQTTCPEPHNDAMLLGEMVKAGLGTEATRAQIMEDLITKGYMYRNAEHRIWCAPAGNSLVAILEEAKANRLMDPALTASWETQLDRIGRRTKDKPTRIGFLNQIVEQIKEISTEMDGIKITDPIVFCPSSGRRVVLSQDGKTWVFGGKLKSAECFVELRGRRMTAANYRDIFVAGGKGGGPFSFKRKADNAEYEAWIIYRASQQNIKQWEVRFKSRGRNTLSIDMNTPKKPGSG